MNIILYYKKGEYLAACCEDEADINACQRQATGRKKIPRSLLRGSLLLTKNIMEKTFVKPTVKGQITIPYKMRQKLGINENTLIQVVLEKDSFVSIPVKVENRNDLYSQSEVDDFLASDQISQKDASFYKQQKEKELKGNGLAVLKALDRAQKNLGEFFKDFNLDKVRNKIDNDVKKHFAELNWK